MNNQVSENKWLHNCERCGYIWTSTNETPGHCSKCNSPYWNKEPVKNNSKNIRKVLSGTGFGNIIGVLENETRKNIFIKIREEGKITKDEILKCFDFNEVTLLHHLQMLEKAEKIQLTRDKKNPRYSVNKKEIQRLQNELLVLVGSEMEARLKTIFEEGK